MAIDIFDRFGLSAREARDGAHGGGWDDGGDVVLDGERQLLTEDGEAEAVGGGERHALGLEHDVDALEDGPAGVLGGGRVEERDGAVEVRGADLDLVSVLDGDGRREVAGGGAVDVGDGAA